VDGTREHEEFRRMEIVEQIEKHERLVAMYLRHLAYWQREINKCHRVLGHIAERLGEPEPEVSR